MAEPTPADPRTIESTYVADEDLDLRRYPQPTGYSYAFAGDWIQIDLRPDRLTDSVRRQLDRRISRFPELTPRRTQLIKMLRLQAHQARDGGVERLAIFAEMAGNVPVTASFNLLKTPGVPSPGGGLTNQPAKVAEHLATSVPDEHDTAGREVGLAELIQQVAVRVRARTTVRDEPSGKRIRGDGVQYYVPRPGSTDLVVLSYHTPCLPAAEPLIAMFDLMAQSFYFTWK